MHGEECVCGVDGRDGHKQKDKKSKIDEKNGMNVSEIGSKIVRCMVGAEKKMVDSSFY